MWDVSSRSVGSGSSNGTVIREVCSSDTITIGEAAVSITLSVGATATVARKQT